jgi:hypothetical protein
MLDVLTTGASVYVAGVSALVSFPLAIGLLQFRSRARALTFVLSIIGMLAVLLFTPVPLSPSQTSWEAGVISVLLILAALAAPIALLILLTGQTRPWRLGLALILYGVSKLTVIWNMIASLGQASAPLDASSFLPLAALTLLSSATLVRYLARDSQFRQRAVILLALAAIAVWVGWCFLARVPLLSVAFSTAFGLAVAAHLIVRDDETRSRTVMVFLALSQLSGFPGGM